jgi:hypothetical protein
MRKKSGELVWLPVGVSQEAIHEDVDNQVVGPGNWHLVVYPFVRAVCGNHWVDPKLVIMASRRFTAKQIVSCPGCAAFLHKVTDTADDTLVISLPREMADRRAKSMGYTEIR